MKTVSKVIIISVLLVVIMAASASAWGIGVAVGIEPLGGLLDPGVMLSFMPPKVPILFGVGFIIGQSQFAMGVTADWWALNRNLVGILNIYMGPGLYFGIAGDLISLGGRLPIGLNIFPIDFLELFIEIAPVLAVTFRDPILFPDFRLMGAFGLRFWF